MVCVIGKCRVWQSCQVDKTWRDLTCWKYTIIYYKKYIWQNQSWYSLLSVYFFMYFFYEVFEATVHTSIQLSKVVMKYTATTLWMSLPLNKSLIIPQGVEQKGQMYKKSSTWYWLKMKDETKMKLRWNKDET